MVKRLLGIIFLLLVSQALIAQVTVLKGTSITVNNIRFATESIITLDKQKQEIEITIYKFPKMINPNGQFEFDIAKWWLSVVQSTGRRYGNNYVSDSYICEDKFSKKRSTAVEFRCDDSDRVDIVVYALRMIAYNPDDGKEGYQLDPVCIINNVDKIN